MTEELFVRLRYCFAAGYSMPQYCVDNGFRKPLFVLEKDSVWFLQEIYAQFHYDGRIVATFCIIDDHEKNLRITTYLGKGLLPPKLAFKNISEINLDEFDKIIFLTKKNSDTAAEKTIGFARLEKFFVQRMHVDIPLLNFLQRYPRVKLFVTNFPSIKHFENGREFNSKLWKASALLKALKSGQKVISPFDEFGYTSEQIIELVEAAKVKRNPDGTSSMSDGDYPLKRIINGKRATAYQPEHFQNRIYFFGSCHHYGVNAPYDKTIESYLQQLINEHNLQQLINEHNLPYRVENEAQHFAGRYQDIFYNLNKLTPAPGDIIFIWIGNLHSNGDVIPFCDVSKAFDPPIDYRKIYCRQNHVNELGYKILAEKYFAFLTANNFFRDKEFSYTPPPLHRIATASRRNSRRAAQKIFPIPNWKLTSNSSVRRKFKSAQSS